MKAKAYIYGIYCTVAALSLSLGSCVKDELFDTPHPDKGAVVVTTDWSGRSGEAAVPGEYLLRIGTAEQSVSGTANVFGTLLLPDTYDLLVCNTPDGMSVNTVDATASVNRTAAGYIAPLPGYLFASRQSINVSADDTLHVTAPMKQYVRRMELELTVTEGDYNRISSATATLDGVASGIDLGTGVRSGVEKTSATLTQNGEKFTTAFRLLGISASSSQTLTVAITFTNGDTQQVESNLTEQFATFNDGVEPLKLTGNLLLPVEGGFTAIIGGWQSTDGGNTDAH